MNAAGWCVAHDPDNPADMAARGRASGRARRQPKLDKALALVTEAGVLDELVRARLEERLPRPGRERRDLDPATSPPSPSPDPLPANEAQALELGLTGPCWWEEDRPPRRPAYDR